MKQKRKKKVFLTDLQKKEICKKYLSGINSAKLSLLYNVSPSYICKTLKSNNVLAGVNKNKIEKKYHKNICERYVHGMSLSQLEKIYGVCRRTIKKILVKNGITTRYDQSKAIDLNGKTVGMLRVLKFANNIGSNGKKKNNWLCECICGKQIIVPGTVLNKNRIKTCGCKLKENLIGKKFGRLTVIKKSDKKDGKHNYWVCECTCGRTVDIETACVILGRNRSCGCRKYDHGNRSFHWKGLFKIPGEYLGTIKKGAKNRGIKFDITPEYMWKLYEEQNKKCIYSGIEIGFKRRKTEKNTASLDRINSREGYIEGNVQWVHKTINFMKQNLSSEEFVNWCHLISKNNLKNI